MHGVYRSWPPRQLCAVVEVRERVLWKCVRVQHEAKSERVHEMAQHPPGFPPTGRLFRTFRGIAAPPPNMPRISQSGLSLQLPSGWLNDLGPVQKNIPRILLTFSTGQSASGWLNDEAPANIEFIFVTLSTRQSFSGWLNDEAP